jgi:predicted nucleic acid-binding protein
MSDPDLTPDFLDTNIFVYAYDPTDRNKQSVAQDLVKKALVGDHLTSVQVLAEFAATLLHKSPHAARAPDVAAVLDALSPIPLVAPDVHMVRRAVEARSRYGIHFYDGMIVAAAEKAGCARILSEDLSAGQTYFGVRVENPFL